MDNYSGDSQVGGKSDPILLLVAIVLLAELCEFQGLDSYLVFLDLRCAFDTVTHDCIRAATFVAGIIETEWEMLDDMIKLDHQFVQLAGLLSPALQLVAGTAQGRRYSLPAVDGVMSWLREF